MRGRSYSYSPSPPRGYSRRRRSPSPPRNGYSRHHRDLPTSLLVRNLSRDCRPEDLRGPFGEFGPLKDVYLPRDYHTGKPRGFGFVQYLDPYDAEDAKYQMDGQVLLGRELTVVFAEENRKKPSEMRARERLRSQSHDWRRSPGRYSRSRSYSLSRSRSRPRSRSPPLYKRGSYHPRSPNYYYSPSPSRSWLRTNTRDYEYRERSTQDYEYYRERSYSRSPPYDDRSRSRSLSRGTRSRSRSYSS